MAFFAQVLLHRGDRAAEDERRVKAVLILANPVHALNLLKSYQQWSDRPTGAEPGGGQPGGLVELRRVLPSTYTSTACRVRRRRIARVEATAH